MEKDKREFRIGDKVHLKNLDIMIKKYIQEGLFENGIQVENLRAICGLTEIREYTVMDVCKSCGFLYISIGQKYLQIRYEYIDGNALKK